MRLKRDQVGLPLFRVTELLAGGAFLGQGAKEKAARAGWKRFRLQPRLMEAKGHQEASTHSYDVSGKPQVCGGGKPFPLPS